MWTMKCRSTILALVILFALPFTGTCARKEFSLDNLLDLKFAIGSGIILPGAIYELSSEDRLVVFRVADRNTPVVVVDGKFALVVANGSYVDGDSIYGARYFKSDGIGQYNYKDDVLTVRKFRELSYKESARIEEEKLRWEAEKAQRIYEAGRIRAIKRALSEIELLTDDRKVIDNAFVNAASVYDSRYQQTESTTEAERAVQEFANKLIGDIKRENERRFQNWAKEHPEEYAAMLKAQEEERQRRAKAKLDRELSENAKRMAEFKEFAENLGWQMIEVLLPKRGRICSRS